MKNVLEYLEETAEKMPDKTAVIDPEHRQSYAGLLDASRLAGYRLLEYVKPAAPVAVMLKKSVRTLEICFGAVYSGGFYSLIDPDFPITRIARVMEVLQPAVVVAEEASTEALRAAGYEGIILSPEALVEEKDMQTVPPEGRMRLEEIRRQHPENAPLYCNFTSGSTGMPKGVLVGHGSVIAFIDDFTKLFGITAEDVVGNQAPFDFDVSVKDIYSCMKTGATLVIIPTAYFRFPNQVMDMLDSCRVTTLIWAVSALVLLNRLHEFMYKVPGAINKVLYSGEEMPAKHLADWMTQYPEASFYNLYGPTEITCNCTYYKIEKIPSAGEKIPIGIPYPQKEVFLLDEEGIFIDPRENDKPGELCVAGNCLAIGYLNNAEATDRSFVTGKLPGGETARYYKTGDLAYYRDGLLYFGGRKDFQIKHNGHRIELEEIERAMNALDEVGQACCVYDETRYRIFAFYTGSEDKSAIVEGLKKRLPEYMIPSVFRHLEQLPLTQNGKADRRGLKHLMTAGGNK